MNFGTLQSWHTSWREVLIIGKSFEREGQNYHILGMTLAGEAKLYLIEPYRDEPPAPRKGARTRRKDLKENQEHTTRCLHCSGVRLGDQTLQVQGGSAGPLEYARDDLGVIQLFFDLMSAGWTVPEWLEEEDWSTLQLVTLNIAGLDKLPKYTPDMPIVLEHGPEFIQHFLEKPVTLTVGKGRTLPFVDHTGESVQCYINSVTRMDLWKDTEEKFQDPRYRELISPERLEQMKASTYAALEKECPRGMYYVAIEYECSKEFSLQFHSREYLRARPEVREGSSSGLLVRVKPDRPTGAHGLPLRGYAIQTAVSSDTVKIPAELSCYYEKVPAWEETVS